MQRTVSLALLGLSLICTNAWSQHFALMNTSGTPLWKEAAATWHDNTGKLWLFGGHGILTSGFGPTNETWNYNPATDQWTLVHGTQYLTASQFGTMGVAASTNTPPARKMPATWTDNSGNFWLYGGYNGTSALSDLWRYNPATNQWTWMGGTTGLNQPAVYGTLGVPSTTNHPGSYFGGAHWRDAAGNFYLYSGNGTSIVWRYNPSTGEWTWMNGTTSGTPVYGTKGVPSTTNTPGARMYGTCASDGNGNAYIFGTGYHNDLWKYNSSTNEWVWLSGSNLTGQNGVYGTKGLAASTNVPGGRFAHNTWLGNNGEVYVFGGIGYDAANTNMSSLPQLNDLWKYDPVSGMWTWMKGSDLTSTATGVNGMLQIPAAPNVPSPRSYATQWKDTYGNFWLYGGFSNTDLWKFDLCPVTLTTSATSSVMCSGSTITLSASGAQTYSWVNGPTGSSIAISPTASTSYTLLTSSAQATCPIHYFQHVLGSSVSAVANPSMVCAGQNVSLTASGADSYTWSSAGTGTQVTTTPFSSTIYTLNAGFSQGCATQKTVQVNVAPGPPLTLSSPVTSLCAGQSATLNASGAASYSWNGSPGNTSHVIQPNSSAVYTITATSPGFTCSSSILHSVQVIAPPQLSISASGSSLCAGQTVTLNVIGAINYTWSNGQNVSSISISPPASTVLSVSGESQGCTETTSLALTVITLPNLSVSGNTNICAGETATLVANGAATYTWNSALQAGTFTLSPAGNQTYTLTGQAAGCYNSLTGSIVVHANPTIAITQSSTEVCQGQSVVIQATGAQNYIWSHGPTANSFTAVPPTTTVYTVTGQSVNNCTATAIASVTVLSLPAGTLSASRDTVCKGESVTLSAAGGVHYSWLPNLAVSPSLAVTPNVSTSYTVAITGTNSCQAEFSLKIEVDACTGLADPSLSKPLLIYPNPSAGQVTFRADLQGRLRLLSLTGQLLFDRPLEQGEHLVADLAAGVYFCEYTSGANRRVQKVVIQD